MRNLRQQMIGTERYNAEVRVERDMAESFTGRRFEANLRPQITITDLSVPLWLREQGMGVVRVEGRRGWALYNMFNAIERQTWEFSQFSREGLGEQARAQP